MTGPTPIVSRPGAERGPRCGVCQTSFEAAEELRPCPHCAAPHHAECWEENGGCAIYGCPAAPSTLKAEPELVQTHWGQEDKECPRCHQRIKVAALRCRFCGAMLDGPDGRAAPAAPPQSSVPLLVFITGLIPFTAPLALVVGTGWLLRRGRWRGLSGAQKALLGLGLVTSVVGVVLGGGALLLGLRAK